MALPEVRETTDTTTAILDFMDYLDNPFNFVITEGEDPFQIFVKLPTYPEGAMVNFYPVPWNDSDDVKRYYVGLFPDVEGVQAALIYDDVTKSVIRPMPANPAVEDLTDINLSNVNLPKLFISDTSVIPFYYLYIISKLQDDSYTQEMWLNNGITLTLKTAQLLRDLYYVDLTFEMPDSGLEILTSEYKVPNVEVYVNAVSGSISIPPDPTDLDGLSTLVTPSPTGKVTLTLEHPYYDPTTETYTTTMSADAGKFILFALGKLNYFNREYDVVYLNGIVGDYTPSNLALALPITEVDSVEASDKDYL